MPTEDMESFLPSEVARLVYGYLEEENCFAAAQAFLESSDHLQECLSVAKRGRKFNTRIMGRNLTGLLDMLSEVASLVKDYAIDVTCDSPNQMKLNAILHLLQININLEKYKTSVVSITSTSQGDESVLDGQSERDKKKLESSQSPDTQNFDQVGDKDLNQSEPRGPDESLGLSIKKELYPDVVNPVPMVEGCNDDDPYSSEHQRYDPGGGGMTDNNSVTSEPPEPQSHQHHQQTSSSNILFQSYNMLHMIQPQQQTAINVQPAYQQSNVSTVYMHAIQPQVTAIQNGLCTFGTNNSVQPAIVSSVNTSTSQQTLWAKPKAPVSRRTTRAEQAKLSPKKRYRHLQPSSVPKLRPIAPKITQVLDNGVEVQVMHTKEAPLVDLAETIPTIVRRSLRSRTKADSTNSNMESRNHLQSSDDSFNRRESSPPRQPPPSPLFIDIQNFELKR